jgi:hypothetical protein
VFHSDAFTVVHYYVSIIVPLHICALPFFDE